MRTASALARLALLLLAACGDDSEFVPPDRSDFQPYAEAAVPGAGDGVTYHVSSSTGSDSNDGRSPEAPLRTIAAASALTLGPGDSVLLRCGDVWRVDPLLITASGSAAAFLSFGSYPEARCADKPELRGAFPVSGWSPSSGSVWVADLDEGENAGRFPAGLNQLFRGEERLGLGRWPNPDEGDGYSTIDSQPGARAIADAELPAGDWSGAVAHIKGMRWYILNRDVTASSAGRLDVGADLDCWDGCAGWGYFLADSLLALDRDGEWHYDPAENRVYLFSASGAPAEIEGSPILEGDSYDKGAVVLGAHLGAEIAYVAVENLALTRWSMHGVTTPTNLELDENHDLWLRHLSVRDVDADGFHLATWVWNAGAASGWRGGRDQVVAWNEVDGANHFGLTGFFRDTDVVGNRLRRVGLLDEIGRSGIGCEPDDGGGSCTEPGDGLRITIDQAARTGLGNLVRENLIEDVGACGIAVFGGTTTIEYNVVRRACSTKGDCGAILTFGRDSLASSAVEQVVIADNIVEQVTGVTDGCRDDFRTLFGFGLYIDNYSRDVIADGNLVSGATAAGILYQSSTGRVTGNLLYGNGGIGTAGLVVTTASALAEVAGNVFAAAGVAQTLSAAVPQALARVDDNTYLHDSAARHIAADGAKSLAEWQAAYGFDAAGAEIVGARVTGAVVVENPSGATASVPVAAGLVHLDGTPAGSAVSLAPYAAELLLPAE